MKIYSNGKALELLGLRGPAGPDGSPIGTIISYMGVTAPKDYLICDGATYPITDYPDLSNFFQAQFGSKNYFGGDGTTTFAVPDTRNLFLRGYHGGAELGLSGEIGIKQNATQHIGVGLENDGVNFGSFKSGRFPKYTDETIEPSTSARFNGTDFDGLFLEPVGQYYTSRPVNMAVLYCIKATESVSAGDIYSTEEQVVGRWIDGRPLYRKVITGTSGPIVEQEISFYTFDFSIVPTQLTGLLYGTSSIVPLNMSGPAYARAQIQNNSIMLVCTNNTFLGRPVIVIVEYTKTTDQTTIELPAALTAAPIQAPYKTAPQSAAAVTFDIFKTEEV